MITRPIEVSNYAIDLLSIKYIYLFIIIMLYSLFTLIISSSPLVLYVSQQNLWTF
jgi:hypothetical protein